MALSMSRRRFLSLTGAAAATGALAGCSSPVVAGLIGTDPNAGKLTYWNLFGGGDGANMIKMEQGFESANPRVPLEATTLAWGNPYYTKLSLATASGDPPDIAVAHLTRLPLLARAGQLSDVVAAGIGEAGITEDSFTPSAWSKATVDGKTYAVPLDTHPFVLYYNTDIAKKAGLLGSDGTLKPITGKDEFIAALQAAQKVTGEWGGVVNIVGDTSTSWRWFATLYYGLGGQVVGENGTKLLLDDDKAARALEFMGSLTGTLKLMPPSVDEPGTASIFSSGKAGFLLDGGWQIPTYEEAGTPFNVVPIPALLGSKPASYADSHALVIPTNPNRSATDARNAVQLIRSLLDQSLTWAQGGHVPAWRPVQESRAFQELQPQANYVQAAYTAQYDPDAWYTGAASPFQVLMGSAAGGVLGGTTNVRDAVASMRSGLDRYTTTLPPVE
jgi:multiple sugar transport system substrate-binding protein